MVITFDWDETNILHIARHNVEPEEAEEILYNRPLIRKSYQNRYAAYGQTNNGRFLVVIYMKKSLNIIRIITARDMESKERRLYERR